MVRLGCEVAGGVWQRALPAMVAIELFDVSLIVIDDVFDKQTRRMGRPTVFAKWGADLAVITGVCLKSMSNGLVLQAYGSTVREARMLGEILSRLEQAHELIYLGQGDDLAYETKAIGHISEREYLNMVAKTTGAEVQAAFGIGGLLGGGKSRVVDALSKYGLNTGIVLQIRDDFIDYLDHEDLIGKQPYSDLARGKKRLPLMLAYRFANGDGKRILGGIAKKASPTRGDIQRALALVAKPKVLERASTIVKKFARSAKRSLSAMKDCPPKTAMKELLTIASNI